MTVPSRAPDQGTVTPLRRPLGVLDLVNLALSILSHRKWCPTCAPSAYQVSQALQGHGIDDLLRAAPEDT